MDEDASLREIVAQSVVEVRPVQAGTEWIGASPDHFGPTLFGGFLLGQVASVAAQATVAPRRVHSLHLYFLRPAIAGTEIRYAVEPLREGRTFGAYELSARQGEKLILRAQFSTTEDVDGYEYELSKPGVPAPAELEVEHSYGPWLDADIGPTPKRADGTYASTRLGWMRVGDRLDDDPATHLAFLAFMTDVTHTGARPTKNDFDTTGIISLDHAIWFHRPARLDEWLLYDVESLINHGGRGVLRGPVRDEAGQLVASVVQETRLFTA